MNLLFKSCLQVRDRATLYLNTLGGNGSVVETDSDVKEFLFGLFDVPLANMETSLKNYVSFLPIYVLCSFLVVCPLSYSMVMLVQEPSEVPFDISCVPKEVKSQPLAEKKAPGKKPTGLGTTPSGPTSAGDAYEKLLLTIPEFASFGKLFKVSRRDFIGISVLIIFMIDGFSNQVQT